MKLKEKANFTRKNSLWINKILIVSQGDHSFKLEEEQKYSLIQKFHDYKFKARDKTLK